MASYSQETTPADLTKANGTNLSREVFSHDFWMTGRAIVKCLSNKP
jgi:hypothetical protein